MNIENLIPKISIEEFTKQQKRSAILSWVAKNMKIRLKDYNITNQPTGYSTRLWGVGRASITKTNMSNTVEENININLGAADSDEEMKEILNELADDIIEQSLIVAEDLINNAKNAKSQAVRNKYYKAVESPEYLKVAFIISVIYYAKNLINKGQNIKHLTLSTKIAAVELNKRKLNEIWRNFANSDKEESDLQSAREKTEEIFLNYENQVIINNSDLDKLAIERIIFEVIGEKNLNALIEGLVEKIRLNITHQLKLF